MREIIKESGVKFPRRIANNPLGNSYWANLIDGALTGLEVVAIGSLDWKLTAIVKLLKSWLADRRKENEEVRLKTEYGYNYETLNTGPQHDPDPWDHSYY